MASGLLHHFNIVRHAATKHVVKKFADHYGLVYFGHVDQHNDDHELVRGITVSTDHVDVHYCVGAIENYDVTLLQRTDIIHFPKQPSKHHTWLILQFDLHANPFSFPHIFLDGKNHSETFYANLFVKFRHLHQVDPSFFNGHESKYINTYKVYMPVEDTHILPHILTPDATAMLGHHFSQFDFEIFDDRLLVYASNKVASSHLLDHMTRSGLWLARHLDKVAENS